MRTILWGAAFAILTMQASSADCLRFGHIYNWTLLNNKTLIVEDDWHQKYRLSISGPCGNPPPEWNLVFKSSEGMSLSCVSRGDEVITRDYGTGPSICVINRIETYTAEMERSDKDALAHARKMYQ